MQKLISLGSVDGTEHDIPAAAITLFEGMAVGKNPQFPSARSYIMYSVGNEDYTLLTTATFNDMLRLLDINVNPANWALVTREDGDRLAFLKTNVVGRSSLNSATAASRVYLILDRSGKTGHYDLMESIDELRAKATVPAETFDSPPPGLVEAVKARAKPVVSRTPPRKTPARKPVRKTPKTTKGE